MIIKDEWMTSFYGSPWCRLDKIEDFKEENVGLFEIRIKCEDHESLSKAQIMGFNIVETFVEFETEVYPNLENDLENIEIREANRHLKDILEITDECYTENKKFVNRFKNRHYFTEDQCKLYYHASIKSSVENVDCITSFAIIDNVIVGYYILKKLKGNSYKGIMSGVRKEYQGKSFHIKMQHAIFKRLGQNIRTINTTQLSNYSIINNHIKEGRKFVKGEYILFFKNH